MKLAKALKQKNLLAGEIAQLKTTLAEQNSRSARQPFDYDTRTVLAQLRAKTDELVALKARLAVANSDAYPQIFRLAELKGLVASLKTLPTKEGVYAESLGYAQNAEVAYVAQIKRAEADSLVETLQAEIQSIQDNLDEYNFTRSIADA